MDLSSTQNEVDGAGTTANLPGGPQAGPINGPEIKSQAGPENEIEAGPKYAPQAGPVNEPKAGPVIESMPRPENELTIEPRTKSPRQKNGRKIIGVIAAVAVVVVLAGIGIVNELTKCNDPKSPEAVVNCLPEDASHEEQVRYLQSKITDATFNLSINKIPEVIAIYEEYFNLLNMQEFPEIYQGCVGDIMKRDFDKKYKDKIVAYTERYDEILQTPDSAGQAYNNFIYYNDTKLMDEYYNLMEERLIEMGIDPDGEGIG